MVGLKKEEKNCKEGKQETLKASAHLTSSRAQCE